MPVSHSDAPDPRRPATRAFAQYLLAMCLLTAFTAGLSVTGSGDVDRPGWVMAHVVIAALAALGAAGAAWFLFRPERGLLAVWWATPAVFASAYLPALASHRDYLNYAIPGVSAALIVATVVQPIAWTVFAWLTARALAPDPVPVLPVPATDDPRAARPTDADTRDVAMPDAASTARDASTRPVTSTPMRELAYRPPAADRGPVPVTRAVAGYVLVVTASTLIVSTSVVLDVGFGMPAVNDLVDARWIGTRGLGLVHYFLVPALLAAAALATLLARPRRRYLAGAVLVLLAVTTASEARDALSGPAPLQSWLYEGGHLLLKVNLAAFVLRVLRHRW